MPNKVRSLISEAFFKMYEVKTYRCF